MVNPARRHMVSSEPSGAARRLLLPAIVGLVCIVVVFVVALAAMRERDRRLEQASQELVALARLLDGQARGAMLAANLALQGVVEGVRRDPALPAHDPAFEESLRRTLPNLPVMRALFVVGSDGFIVQDSDRETPRRNLTDRDYFQAQRQGDAGLFVGKPWISRSTGTWFIGVSRRLEGPDGEFRGVVVAALETRFLEESYSALGLGDSDVIGLLSPDGTVVARHPSVEGVVGRPLAARTPLLEALRRSPSGTFKAAGSGGRPRLFAYQSVTDTPLVVLVGRSRADVLAPWSRNVAMAGAVTILALVLGALLCWLLIAQARRDALRTAQTAEAERLEALGQLTSGVAHDFNNLLQSMAAALSLLGQRAGPDEEVKVIVKQGLGSIERGQALVAQLLGVVRRHETAARDVDVNAVLTDMERLLRHAAAPGATIELQLDGGPCPCRIDPARLDAAILNLVVNARDSIPDDAAGSGRVRISTRACQGPPGVDGAAPNTSRFVCLTIADNGAGMTPETRRRALEPFFTTKGERGTGLGLAQVHAFVREAGGEVGIDSDPGVGTAVHLYFPWAEPPGSWRV